MKKIPLTSASAWHDRSVSRSTITVLWQVSRSGIEEWQSSGHDIDLCDSDLSVLGVRVSVCLCIAFFSFFFCVRVFYIHVLSGVYGSVCLA